MARRLLLTVTLAALLLAGCVTPGGTLDAASTPALPTFDIKGADVVERTDASATFLWKGTIGPSSRVPGLPAILALPQLLVPRPGPAANPAVMLDFSPPHGVPFLVNVTLTFAEGKSLSLDVLGNRSRQCTAGGIGGGGTSDDGFRSCQTRIYDALDKDEAWGVVVTATSNGEEKLPFEVLLRIEAAAVPASPPAPRLVAHRAGGALPVPAEFESLAFKIAPTGALAAEPTLGVTKDGTIYTTSVSPRLNPAVQGVGAPALRQSMLARSTDDGDTWTHVGHPLLAPPLNFDPWMWVDPITDRVFDAPLYVECSWAHWSDDGGRTWDANPATGCGLPDHDHQKVTTGPSPKGVMTIGYPNVVYYSYNPFRGVPERLGTYVTVSLDGGRTWSVGQETVPRDCAGGISGGVAVAPDGTAYSSHGGCDGLLVAVSRDAGSTWSKPVRAGSHHLQFSNPDIGFDRDGVAYLAHSDDALGVSLTTSRDGGNTWTPDVDALPPELRRAVFPVLAVGEPGKVAISYLATTADASAWPRGGDPSYAPDSTVWHSYVTISHDALSDDPTWVTIRVTPDDDPVQVGCIWLHGGGAECRNLLDFIDSTQHEGRVYTVRADGCDACEKASRPQARQSSVVEIQTAGPTLGPAWWADAKRGELPLGELVGTLRS